ncbi:hypothetical protein Ciccas_014029 [Cichlidogyrus casuarinus]|uniref:ABC transmembrane type-1 domain-containing protein n=1 Tax=Cichlidogyrus casuarinus TaxID=1844966 RepID=A0ABD2PJ30_9PLAT
MPECEGQETFDDVDPLRLPLVTIRSRSNSDPDDVTRMSLSRISSIYSRTDTSVNLNEATSETQETDAAVQAISEGVETLSNKKKRKIFFRLLKMNRPEMLFLIGGAISSGFVAAVAPFFGVVYSFTFALYQKIYLSIDVNAERNLLAGMMFLIAWIRLISNATEVS